jgi:hypothetical protein
MSDTTTKITFNQADTNPDVDGPIGACQGRFLGGIKALGREIAMP